MKVIIPGAAVMLFAVFGLGILAAGGQGGPSPSAFGPAFQGSGAIADGSQGAIGRTIAHGRQARTQPRPRGEPRPRRIANPRRPSRSWVRLPQFPSGILFANDLGELSDIMFVDPSGDNLRPVLPGPTDDSWPSWSPDRTRIAFTRVTDGHGEIWLIDFNGKETRITSGADDWEPNWSPDGSLLTFWRVTNGHDEIWVVRNDGSDATAITHGPDFDVSPSWSPNGDLIAFSSTRSHDGGSYLYTYNTSSREVVRRTFPESKAKPAMDSWPAWSGDGSCDRFRACPRLLARQTNDLAARHHDLEGRCGRGCGGRRAWCDLLPRWSTNVVLHERKRLVSRGRVGSPDQRRRRRDAGSAGEQLPAQLEMRPVRRLADDRWDRWPCKAPESAGL